MSELVLVALVGLVSASFGVLVTAFIAWRKWLAELPMTKADMAARLTEAASSFIDDLRQQIKDQQDRIKELEDNQKARNTVIVEQDKRIRQLVDDILIEQQQKRRLEGEIKLLKQHDASLQAQIRNLRTIIEQAGLKANGDDPQN